MLDPVINVVHYWNRLVTSCLLESTAHLIAEVRCAATAASLVESVAMEVSLLLIVVREAQISVNRTPHVNFFRDRDHLLTELEVVYFDSLVLLEQLSTLLWTRHLYEQ